MSYRRAAVDSGQDTFIRKGQSCSLRQSGKLPFSTDLQESAGAGGGYAACLSVSSGPRSYRHAFESTRVRGARPCLHRRGGRRRLSGDATEHGAGADRGAVAASRAASPSAPPSTTELSRPPTPAAAKRVQETEAVVAVTRRSANAGHGLESDRRRNQSTPTRARGHASTSRPATHGRREPGAAAGVGEQLARERSGTATCAAAPPADRHDARTSASGRARGSGAGSPAPNRRARTFAELDRVGRFGRSGCRPKAASRAKRRASKIASTRVSRATSESATASRFPPARGRSDR